MQIAKVATAQGARLLASRGNGWFDLTAGYGLYDISAVLRMRDEIGLDTIEYCPPMVFETSDLLAPIDKETRILCTGFNYRDHAAEAEREEPKHPTFFTRFTSSLVGPGEPLILPAASSWLDWEGELAVVIGRAGRALTRANAMEHVGGYVCFGDHSIRDFQLHGTQATAGKNFDSSGAIGPWIVTADEVGDPGKLEVLTYLNGERVQHGRLTDLIFDIPALLSYVSTFMELRPGDVIATGTPAGIGGRRTPPRWLTVSDEIVVEVPKIGRLSNSVSPAMDN